MDDLTALALEYQADYGRAHGDLRVTHLMNNPTANGVCRVFGLGFKEEGAYGVWLEIGSVGDDAADSLLIGLNTAETFSKELLFEDLPRLRLKADAVEHEGRVWSGIPALPSQEDCVSN